MFWLKWSYKQREPRDASAIEDRKWNLDEHDIYELQRQLLMLQADLRHLQEIVKNIARLHAINTL